MAQVPVALVFPGTPSAGLVSAGGALWQQFTAVEAFMHGQAKVDTADHVHVIVTATMHGQASVVLHEDTTVSVTATMHGQASVIVQESTARNVSATMQGQATTTTTWASTRSVSAMMEGQASVVTTEMATVNVSATMQGQATTTTTWATTRSVSAMMEGQASVVTTWHGSSSVSATMEGQASVVTSSPSTAQAFAGLAALDTSVGTIVWATVTNAEGAPDGLFATSVTVPGNQSEYLYTSNYGFSIPGGSTIDGILVEYYRKATTATGVKDYSVRLNNGSGFVGTDKATGTNWSTTVGYVGYGGSSDLWGRSWSVSEVNSAGFGAGMSVQRSSGPGTADVDAVRITIYYH